MSGNELKNIRFLTFAIQNILYLRLFKTYIKMDALSQELQDFLIRLGKEPNCVSEKIEHYVKHIMHIIYADDETMLQQYYGLFGNDVKPLEDIAKEHSVSTETMRKIIEANVRRMAVSPEWQMVKQLIK